MSQSEMIGDLAKALSQAQGAILGAYKDAKNPFYKSDYATLASVLDAIRGPLEEHGLAVVQTTYLDGDRPVLRTVLMHSSGEWIDGFFPVLTDKPGPQGMGAGMTYARRFALSAMVGVSQIDLDGEDATDRTPQFRDEKAVHIPTPGKKAAGDRERVNKKLMEMHKPFMTMYPLVHFKELLKAHYGVEETRLMTLEQLEDLIDYLEKELKKKV